MAYGTGMRAGDAQREQVAGLLREHYAAGRLTQEEFQQRLDAVYAARTLPELAALTADLPAAAPGPGAAWSIPAGWPSPRGALRRLRLTALGTFAAVAAVCTAAAVWLPHGVVIAVILAVLMLPALLVAALAGAAVWLARRAWRSGAWLEAVPAVAGAPWLGRAIWGIRALLAGRLLWRAGRRIRRPVRARRAGAWYQDGPGGAWHQARVSDSGGAAR